MTWKITGTPGTGENLLYSQAGTPTLDLRFASSKSLNDYVSGQNLVDFTRASSGTYVGSDGLIQTATTNEPRFNHDPTTGESLGLLVEESRTNLIVGSETYQAISFTEVTTPAPTNNTEIAPDGNQSAFEYPVSAANRLQRNYTVSAGATYTFSFFAKQGNGTEIISYSGFSSGGDRDDVSTVVYDWTTNTLDTNWNKEDYANGWSRFFKSYASTTGTTFICWIDNGSGGVYFWGFGLVAGSFPTSYIPTEGSTVTRAADVASISGSNFSSWYRQDEGTVFTEYTAETSIPPANQAIVTIESAATNNGFRLYQQATTGRPLGQWQTPAGLQANFPFTSLAIEAGITSKIATAFADADFAGATSIQPGNIAVFNSGTVPTGLVSLGIGVRSSNSTFFANGTIRRLVYFDRRLPNATLQVITT